MNKYSECPFCGKKKWRHQIRKVTIHYKSHPLTYEQPGLWCDSCREGVIGGTDRNATQKILQTFRAKIDGLLSPDEVKSIRKTLKMTQHTASSLFGGGVNAFSRYERGETPVPKSLAQLLTLLHNHPELIRELRRTQKNH